MGMIDNLPQGWNISTLGEICSKPQYGWTSKASHSGTLRYVRTTDISNGKINWEKVPFCFKIPDDIKKYKIQKDDILVSRAGSVGVSYRIKKVPFDAVFASYLIRFKPIQNIDPKYIEYYLKSDEYWKSISDFTAGIAIPNVNASKLSQLKIPVAPINEQRRIVARLEKLLQKIDACKERLDKIPTILKRFRQSILAAACTGRLTADWRGENPDVEPATELLKKIQKERKNRYEKECKKAKLEGRRKPKKQLVKNRNILEEESFDIPDNWAFCFFEDIAANKPNPFKAGPFGSSLTKSCYVPSGYKIYGQEQVIRGDYSYGDYYIDEEKFLALKTCEVRAGDILVSLVGTIGKVLIIPDIFEKGIINPRLIKITLFEEISRKYIASFLSSTVAMNTLRKDSHGGTMDILNMRMLKNLPIPLPPITEQHEIVRCVEVLFKVADQIEERYKKGKAYVFKLTQSILAKAFRGELVPQDPNDELASELLKQIQEEKDRQTKKREKKVKK
ncbi:MAG: restriction endonuclease subunit S [Deltaproteobacteria bacterium]|jgi:type I restriction enzyme S subunit|nr:restriction endonuclease subunit S [Deltaproteobacteria bacterium]